MKIPRSVEIKGQKWQVLMKKVLLDDDGEPCYGLCDYKNRVIYLEKGMSKELEAETFAHEINHATLYESHISLSRELDEAVCAAIAFVTTQLFHLQLKK